MIRAKRKSGCRSASKAMDLSFFSFFAAHLAQVRNMLRSRRSGLGSRVDRSDELVAAVALPGLGLLELRRVCGSSGVTLITNCKSWPDLEFDLDRLASCDDA